ncbi:MAG TPA: hypothetical protein VNO75_11560 [Gemmatimonadaceae bacterium]|nr:hypothetical protein [Gemmatimonadaceae bacterium]
MLRILLTGVAIACGLGGGPNRVEAQEPAVQSEYDARAIRVESAWGFRTLVRGREGTFLGRIGDFRAPDVAAMVAPSEVAVREAKEFKRRYDRAHIATIPATALLFVGLGVTRLDGLDASALVPAYTAAVAGGAILAYAAVQLNKGYSALGRAIWWYNRDLPR